MVKVALVKCEDYTPDAVGKAVERGLDLIGGPALYVNPGERIVLKPNLLSADIPSKCTTTHPAVFRAVAEAFQRLKVTIAYGDSPAFHKPETASTKAGLAAMADKLGIELTDFQNGQEVFFEEGIQNKKFTIAKGILAADGLISLPKLKTHGFEKITGAIKNQFGCIPGTLKGEFHVKIPDANNFARMLVDLNRFLKPRLFIMDGIIAMEGNGPRGGNPRQLKVLLFSYDPVALDATVCRMINLNPELVPTNKFGQEAGLGTYIEEQIEIVGDALENFYCENFDVNREVIRPYKGGGFLNIMKNSFVPRPQIMETKCVKCGVCVNMCPVLPKALDWHDGNKTKAPGYDYRKCIRCYCCQELCPESAINLRVPPIRRMFTFKK